MHRQRIRSLITSLGLTVPITGLTGCGDPCADDGIGQLGSICGDTPEEADDADSDGEAEPEREPGPDEPPDDADETGADETGADEPGADETGADEPAPEIEVELLFDADADGFGDPGEVLVTDPSTAPAGYVPASAGEDCDDDDPQTHPGAAVHEDLLACTNDDDGDGWGDEVVGPGVTAGLDCDDESATTFPGAAVHELATACTNDDDGDGWGDRDVLPGVDPGGDCADEDPALYGCHLLWCLDGDGDGYGDPASCSPGGDMPPSQDHVSNDDDCNDASAAMHPGKAVTEPQLCTVDLDGDGYGPIVAPPGGDPGTDCHDGAAFAFPGASENEAAPLHLKCTLDADGDGHGDVGPGAGIAAGTDCDDSSANTYVGAAELEDDASCMTDEDLDGYGAAFPKPGVVPGLDCEDADPTVAKCHRWCADLDGDGWGRDALWGLWGEDPGAPWVNNCSDCQDQDAQIHPGAAAAEPALCTIDADLDGYGDLQAQHPVDAGNDCDDASADAFPGAAALEPALCTVDADGDGYGDAEHGAGAGSDCDDASALAHPGAAPGDDPSACMLDADGDDYGAVAAPAGVTPGSDCDDVDPTLADCQCLAPIHYVGCDGTSNVPTADPLQAFGLGCSDDPVTSMVLESSTFVAVDAGAWAVIHRFGDALDPNGPGPWLWSTLPYDGDPDAHDNGGNNLLLLSTGPVTPPDANGVLVEAPGSQAVADETGNLDSNVLPGSIVALDGSNGGAGGTPFLGCDGLGDCSGTLAALGLEEAGLFDQVFFELELVVPAGVDGLRFDVAMFSSEYPDAVGLLASDVFVVWVKSAAFTGNVAVTATGAPLTVTGLANAGELAIVGDDPRLSGTGFEGHGGTGWRSIVAPAVPGETLRVAFLLADAVDPTMATAVLLDDFRWDCAGCDGIDECGLTTLP